MFRIHGSSTLQYTSGHVKCLRHFHHRVSPQNNSSYEQSCHVEPGEPVQPLEPIEPVEPTEPVAPVRPVEPVEPAKPVGPVDPVGVQLGQLGQLAQESQLTRAPVTMETRGQETERQLCKDMKKVPECAMEQIDLKKKQ